MQKNTAKTAGKFIVIILGMAIVFFLLLPFLELNPSTQSGHSNRKASPQIFTTNPLSELVRKVYSIFAGKSKAQNQFKLASASATETQPHANADAVAAAHSPLEGTEAASAGSKSTSATYDTYGNAHMLDDNGEWVLIQQSAPEASQRGMHDINSSDKAYDKFIHLERAAKYTGGSQPAPIPDAAWARLWKPVQSFFGDKPKKKAVEQPASEDIILAAANGPTTGLGQKRVNDIYEGRQRTKRPGLSDSDFAFNPSAANPVFTLLNPTQELQDTADALIETAKAILPPEEAGKVAENINKNKEQLIRKTLQIMEDKFNQDAEQEQAEELVSKTISPNCENSLSGFYRSSSSEEGDCYAPKTHELDEITRAQQTGREQLRTALEKLIGYPYQAPKPIKMVVVLNKTAPGDDPTMMLNDGNAADISSPGTSVTPEEATRVFYQYLYEQQGCDKQDCYWVGSEVQRGDPSLRQTIDSSGLQFAGDPLGILQKVVRQFMDEMYQSPNERDIELAQMLQNQAKLPIYTPYTKDNFNQVNEEHNKPVVASDGSKKSPLDPVLYYTGNAANAKEMREIFPSTAIVFYDNKEKGVLAQNALTPIEKGEIIRESLVNRVEQGTQALVEAKAELSQSATQDIVQHMGPHLQKQARQALKRNTELAPKQSVY